MDFVKVGAEVEGVEVVLEAAADGCGSLVHLGDVPVDEALGREPGVQTVVDGVGGPGAHAAVEGILSVTGAAEALPVGQTAGGVAQDEGADTVGAPVGEVQAEDAAEGLADVHHVLDTEVVEDGVQVIDEDVQ